MQRHYLAALLIARLLFGAGIANAAVVASGFQDTAVTTVSEPSVLAFAPDGRLFIGEKSSGKIRVYKSGTLLTQPFLNLNDFMPAGTYFDTFNERGLLGIAFDPSFNTNGFVYVYYTICKTPGSPPQPGTSTCVSAKNRVARFTASGDVVSPGSHVVLLDDIDSDAGNHNSGWLGFGPLDGKLYASTGDGGSTSAKAQNLGSLNGKVLRINSNGTIPSDNPFVGQTGARGEVWALGLRNPFRCRFASDGRLFCADVGQVLWEEINVITKGANYGWPTTEGPFAAASFPTLTNPVYSYAHNSVNAAIIGGDFGAKTAFPGNYQQSFFFADYTRGVIQRALLAPSGVAVQSVDDLLTNIGGNSVTDMVAGPDGSLYYTYFSTNQVRRLTATGANRSPIAVASANVVSGVPPLTVNFSSAGTSDPDGDTLTYSWNFGDGTATSSVANPTHQYASSGKYVATLTVSDGKATPGPGTATVTITVGRPPAITISSPIDGASFRAGDVFTLNGSAVDPEDGALPASSLHWQVIFHHADHTHPFIDDLVGVPQSFQTNTGGEPDPDVGYEIVLSATDSTGLTGSASVFILPITSTFTLQTSPAGLGVTLDGQPITTPSTITGVVGLRRTLGAPASQTSGGQTYYFSTWSDGGLPTHDITTPEVSTTFTAAFTPPATCSAPFVIPAQGGTFASSTGGASALSGTCAASTTSGEQVFQWTPAVSGTATLATCGGSTSFDTVLYVRSGNCATGAQVACADDAAGCTTTEPNDHHASLTTLGVTAGQTYFIVVDGYSGASGTFTLTVTPPSGTAPTATRTATPAPTPSPTRTATPIPSPTPSRTVTPLPTVTATRTITPVPTVTATPIVTATPSPAPCNPIQVPAGGGTFTGTTSGASKYAGTCAASGNSPDQVFQWTPAASGTAVISTCGGTTSFDTALYVRTGSCDGTQFACNDDTAGCATTEPNDHHASRISSTVTAGTTYFIIVDGYNGAAGDFTLTITPPVGASPTASTTSTPVPTATPIPTVTATRTATPIPTATTTPVPTATKTVLPTPVVTATPDACNSVTVVPPQGGTFSGATSATSSQSGSCGLTDKSGERIYQWTPAVSGQATIGTCGSATLYDTVVYLRSGTCGGSEVVCVDDVAGCTTGEPNDHHGSQITPTVTAGQTYFIVVDGYNGTYGAYSLTIVPPVAATATPTVTATPIATPTATRTATPVPTVTNLPSPTTTRTATPLPTVTPLPTTTPIPSVTATPSDACANPTVIPAAGGTFNGVTSGDNSQSGSCALTNKGPERVFQWTPVTSGTAIISTCDTATLFDTVVYLRSGTCTGNEVACNDDTAGCATGEPNDHHGSRITPVVTAGQTYFIVVDGYDVSEGAFALTVVPPAAPTVTPARTATPLPTATLTVVATATPTPLLTATRTATPIATGTPVPTATTSPVASPAPDQCGATIVPASGGTFSGVTSGSSAQAGSCGVTDKGPEAVFQWTPSASGQATIGTCGAGTLYDSVVYLRSGTCGGAELACVDDVPGCTTGEPNDHHGSQISPTVVAGQTYFIVVDGYDGAQGAFTLTITPPPDGTCSAPFTIPPGGGVMSGTTKGASALASCGYSDASPEAVYRWTPTTSGTATLETCGSQTTYDTVLYISRSVCGGPALTCVDDAPGCGTSLGGGGSRITPTVTAGETYYVVVDGFGGQAGDFRLNVIPPP